MSWLSVVSAQATSDPSSMLGAVLVYPGIPKLPHSSQKAKLSVIVRLSLTQLSQKVSQISKIHGVKFGVCLQVAEVCGQRGSSSLRFGRNAPVPRSGPGGAFLQEAEMPPPPQSQRGRTPNFKEDDAVFAPQAMTLFLKEYKCPLPMTRVTTLESYPSQPR